jgi:hypothetical protein
MVIRILNGIDVNHSTVKLVDLNRPKNKKESRYENMSWRHQQAKDNTTTTETDLNSGTSS